ncbi:MAG: hypothetical protein ACE5I1_07700 [bacterium]
MAETQRQQLTRILSIVEEYTTDGPPNEIESAFLQLEELDRSKNLPLWIALKSSLRQNKAIQEADVITYITNPSRAKEGFWWHDPRKWLF